jgi:CHAT domain-containing protein
MEVAEASLELRPPDDHQGREISLTNLGVVHEAQGDNEAAIRAFHAAAIEAEKSKEPKSLAITAVNIGIQLRKAGRPGEARPHLEQALRLADEIKFARLSAAARRELGLALVAVGERDAGATLLTEALAEAEKIGSAVDLAETQLAIALHVPGNQKAAAERALKFARDAEQPEFEWAALALLGDLESGAGANARAVENYTQAVGVIERMRRQVAGGDIQRQTFFADKLRPYHALVELHFAAGDLTQAFHWIQQAKARVLLDSLSLERRQVSTAAPAEHAERMEALQVRVAEARGAKDRGAIEAARIQLDAVASEVAAPALLAPVADLRELTGKLLDPDTALLEYLVLPDRIFLSILTVENGEPALEIHPIRVTAVELRRKVEELRAALATRQLGYEPIATKLATLLIEPAAKRLQERRRLIVAPSGSLWQLPFQALRDAEDRFLIDRFALSYAPSASSMLQMNEAAEKRRNKKTLVMSNPERPDSAEAFPDLPGSSRFAAELPPVYGNEATVVLAGAAATEHALKTRAGDFDTLHCAVHGVFDPATPLQSHLRLAAGDGEDGLLEAREIMELRIDASLAVLAACETARGGEDAGEGIIGMSWAFFLARCPAVVASQWKVDSASISELSLGFHKRRAAGADAATAMQEAALALRKNRAYRHPFYWAPFIVIGGRP